MKRVLIVVRHLQAGGTERGALDTARELHRQGHDVHLLLLKDSIEYDVDFDGKLHVYDIDKAFRRTLTGKLYSALTKVLLRNLIRKSGFVWAGLYYPRYFNRFVKRLEADMGAPFDIIIMRGTGAYENLWRYDAPNYYILLENIPRLLDKERGPLVRWYFRLLHRRLYRGKKVITNAESVKESLLSQCAEAGAPLASVRTIYNVSDLDGIRRKANEQTPPLDKPFIVHVGRLMPIKRQDILLEAFARTELDCDLVIVGKGAEERKLRRLARDLGIQDRVRFVGFVANPYCWMKHARLLALSSEDEGLPMVIIESLACGTPVVSTDCPGGVREILRGEQAKGLAEHLNPDSLAEKMVEMFYHPVEVRSEWVEPFRGSAVVRQYLELAVPDDSMGS